MGIDKLIGVLRLEPKDLEGRGLVFEEDYDNLDYLQHARLDTPTGKTLALVRHGRSPITGTEIVTREDSTDVAADLEEALQRLGLTRDDVAWAAPEIAAAWDREKRKSGVVLDAIAD